MRRRLSTVATQSALIAITLVTLTPFAWMVSASLMHTGEAMTLPIPLLPAAATLDQYRDLFARLALGPALRSSLIIAFLSTLLSLGFNSAAGYAFAKLRFPGRDRVLAALLAMLVIPGQVGMLPLFLLLRSVHLVNTIWGVILPSMAGVFGIFMVRQYALSIPDELLDAARVDGASEWRIYRSIVLPLLRPILATLAVFTFMSSWNDFLWPLIVLTDDRHYTLPVALANLLGEHAQDTELMMAGSVLTVLPVLLLFAVLQRQYITGITAGGIKE